jgi:hypothetical protein
MPANSKTIEIKNKGKYIHGETYTIIKDVE